MALDPRFHIWIIMTVYYKVRQILLQNAIAILLQNVTEVYYKMRQVFSYEMRRFCYKIRQLLKMGRLLQIATVQVQIFSSTEHSMTEKLKISDKYINIVIIIHLFTVARIIHKLSLHLHNWSMSTNAKY